MSAKYQSLWVVLFQGKGDEWHLSLDVKNNPFPTRKAAHDALKKIGPPKNLIYSIVRYDPADSAHARKGARTE